MPYVPQSVPTDSQILWGMLGILAISIVGWFILDRMEKSIEKKEEELKEELEEEEETGEVY
ncbi:hypothetical protein [Thermococcus sp.]